MVGVEEKPATARDSLHQLRGYLSERAWLLNARLPPERELSRLLGVSRADLRKALAVLESEGQVWRHVGRGTFIGARPVHNLHDVAYLGELANPAQVIEARLAVEPQLARLAALHGVRSDFDQIRTFSRRCREAKEWRVYEAWDNNLHQAIATATHNKLLINLFDTLNAVRRSTVWGQLRSTTLPPADHESFDEHDDIHLAIANRDADRAAEAMRIHLRSVRDRLLAPQNG
jgi:GntR family uxuAB operon transcriptional repressor